MIGWFGDGSRVNFRHCGRVSGLFCRRRFSYVVLVVDLMIFCVFLYRGYEILDGYREFGHGCCDRVGAIERFGGEAGPAVVTIG